VLPDFKRAIACTLLSGLTCYSGSALAVKSSTAPLPVLSSLSFNPSQLQSDQLQPKNRLLEQSPRVSQTAAEVFLKDGTLSPATDGFWRQLIPATAQYESANLNASSALFDLNYNVITSNSDPLIDVYLPAGWERRVGGTRWLARVRFPFSFVLPDAGRNNTPNNPLCTVNRDTKQSQCFNSVARPRAGSPLYAYRSGSHGGSGLSGGDITGAALNRQRIEHAIGILIWARPFLSSHNRGFTAPAVRADSYASEETYQGRNINLVMGSRLALRPDATARNLGVSCQNLFPVIQALRQYGAYVVDDSAWDVFYLSTDVEAAKMLQPCRADLLKIYRALQIVMDFNQFE
jgi:hypothetical protein